MKTRDTRISGTQWATITGDGGPNPAVQRGWNLSEALAVSLVTHKLARFSVILDDSVPLELIQSRLTPAYAIKPLSAIFWFNCYCVIVIITLSNEVQNSCPL